MNPLLIANWKMNPRTLGKAEALLKSYALPAKARATVVVCPPSAFLLPLGKLRKQQSKLKKIVFGAQDVGPANDGAFTGELSPSILKDVGASYVIVGHSERRSAGETNERINEKVRAALSANLNVLLCVGEAERANDGADLSFIKDQIDTALEGVPKTQLGRLTICYEPVWAIGTGNPASAGEAIEVGLFILRTMASRIGKHPRTAVRVLYGGSVTPENAHEYLEHDVLSGFLVGGASLNSKSFLGILNAFNS